MKRPKKVALGVFASLLLVALLCMLQANLKTGFLGDPYEHEVTGEVVIPDPDAELLEEEWEEPEEPSEVAKASDLDLPTGELYADAQAPALPAGCGVKPAAPIVSGNKTLIPLYPEGANACIREDFLTLSEAVEAGRASIVESGSVSTVYVVNKSTQPIFIMCGEIIFGGNQDRIIAQDIVIPAETDRKFQLKVFCVESGRWTPSDKGHTFTCKLNMFKKEVGETEGQPEPAAAPSPPALAQERQEQEDDFANLAGRGITYACILSGCGEGGQSEVWSRVSQTNKRLGTDNATNTYRNNLASMDIHERMKHDLKTFLEGTKYLTYTIGYAFAVDGNVLFVDIFANSDLCHKFRHGLIKAYLLDTLGKEQNAHFAPRAQSVKDFLQIVEAGRLAEKARPGFAFYKSACIIGCDFTYEGKRLHSGYYYDSVKK